ncbi:MAG TPA: hypothetical protein VL944_02905 [Candidatus Acidoferrum sp.]|nr:hypothetical protein [Candidatus Acidoferrum sp.]
MELLGRVAIIALIIIVIVGAALLVIRYAVHNTGPLTAAQASQIVQRDLKQSYPNASISIINTSPSTLAQNSWNVFVSLVYNATRPCPTLYLEEYDYPATGLVPSVSNLYTRGCVIYGLTTSSLPYYTYIITSPEVAIAKSFNSSFPSLVVYVNTYGYNNTNVYATHYAALNLGTNIDPSNTTFSDVWLINYTATQAPRSQYVVLNSTGSIIYNYTLSH